jgi:hypothetical protein
MCLRDLLRITGGPCTCFYCGLRATQVDHDTPRSRRPHKRGRGDTVKNLKAACKRCNHRKGPRTSEEFRAHLAAIDQAYRSKEGLRAPPGPTCFHGEGLRGKRLKALRYLLACVTLHRGEVIIVAPGEPFTPRDEVKSEKETVRWWGRFTFHGHNALRAIRDRSGLSFTVIERFVMGVPVGPDATKRLTATFKTLKLDIAVLRAMKPAGPLPKTKKRKRVVPTAERITAAQKLVAIKTGHKPRHIPFKD